MGCGENRLRGKVPWLFFMFLMALSPAAANGAIQCYDCHGGRSTADYRPRDASFRNISTGGVSGNHQSHLGTGATPTACVRCHPDSAFYTTAHRDGKIKLAANINASPQAATYRNQSSAFPQTAHPSPGTCTNVNCHFEAETPPWGATALALPGDCAACHGAAPADGNHPATSGPGKKHGDYLGTDTGSCGACHTDHRAEASPFAHATSAGKRPLLVRFTRPPNTGGTYSGDVTYPQYLPSRNPPRNGTCSGLYCHSNGTSAATGANPTGSSPAWGSAATPCSGCHGYPPAYANGAPKANNHQRHAFGCNTCHAATTADGSTITTIANHVNGSYNVDAAGVSFVYTFAATGGSCTAISCHGSTAARWGTTSCLGCHAIPQGNRVAITPQFDGTSHHVQGALADTVCYHCHWEANADGSINPAYHGGGATTGAAVDLVIYGTAERPGTYTAGVTGVQYTADGSRSEIGKVTSHCLGCHSDQNNAVTPFGDGNTPNRYAWDGTSVAARYNQSGKTVWGKYSTANGANKRLTKAYSAHGKAADNQRGWDGGSGVDGAITNTSGGVNVQCYDCHNSHGSAITGITSRYSSATGRNRGAILKETTSGRGGYAVTYRPMAGGSAAEKNLRNAGASLCLDCHMSATPTEALAFRGYTTPWGFTSTYGASQAIIGYWDSPYLGTGSTGAEQRHPYKGVKPAMGGHFGASSPLSGPPTHAIGGLCTPCHDPHGVSPTLGANQQYAVPLLKGTWVTSPYQEDAAPADTGRFTARTDLGNGVPYHIDQNTFGSGLVTPVAGMSEAVGTSPADSQSAGLCLGCHAKSSLTDGATHTWKSKDRIHESVKGWKTANATVKHNYSCSKCHTPHSSATLPRLMVTNCLDSRHKGRTSFNPTPVTADTGWGSYSGGVQCYGVAAEMGSWCPSFAGTGAFGGGGNGSFPGSWSGARSGGNSVACHESNSSDQSWNVVTPWTVVPSAPPAPPTIGTPQALSTAAVRWNFSGAAQDTLGFRLHDPAQAVKASTTNPSASRLDESGLTANTRHTRHVHAYNGAGESAASADASVYTLPAAPAVAADRATATWSGTTAVTFTNSAGFGPGGVAYYRYAWDQNPTYAFTGSEPQWSAGSLTTDATAPGSWYLHVRAYNGDNIAGSPQNYGPYYYDGTPPAAAILTPANGSMVAVTNSLTFTLADSQSGVDWSTVTVHLAGNNGYAKTYTAAQTAIVTKSGSAASYSVLVSPDAPFGSGESITVSVAASDTAGNALATPAWTFTATSSLPAAPTLLSATTSFDGSNKPYVTWSWTDNATNETGFYLQSADNTSTVNIATANTTSYPEWNLPFNTRYTRHVHATNASGTSPPTADVSIYTRAAMPNVTADKATSTWFTAYTPVTFSDAAGFGAGGVEYYSGGWNQSATPSGSEITWSSGTLSRTPTADGSWYLHLWSCNGDASCWLVKTFGPFWFDAHPPTGLAPATPADGATGVAAGTPVTATAATDGASGGVQYAFQVALDGDFTVGVQNSGWQSGTGYAPLLAGGTTYYWRVKARDGVLNETPATAPRSFTTASFPTYSAAWTTRGDFTGNAATTATATTANAVQLSGLAPTDDAAVTLAASAVSTLAGGSSHTLALTTDGAVWAWGGNTSGQLGDGTTTQRNTPQPLAGLTTGVVAIAAGNSHSLALKADGTLWAWGGNSSYQLGDGTTWTRYSPGQVTGVSGVVAVAAGLNHSLAVKADGTVWAWGSNNNGQLGDGTTTQRTTAVQLTGISGVVAVAARGNHSLALKADGSVWAWGNNGNGQLGDGTTTQSLVPVQVSGLNGVTGIAAGDSHSLALKADGTVWAWGNNGNGQLGDGTTTQRTTPVQVPGMTGITSVSAGWYHSLTLKADGSVWAWGNNGNGQLGDGTTTQRLSPVPVTGLSGIIAAAAGGSHSLALKPGSSFVGWGANTSGQLGDGTVGEVRTPVAVTIAGVKQPPPAMTVAAGDQHALAVKADGTVWAWGYGYFGQLGNGTSGSSASATMPVQVTGLTGVSVVAAGSNFSLALKADGTVWAWGNNGNGQLGDGTTTQRTTPVQVPGLGGIVAIAAGSQHALAVAGDGSVWAWGRNYNGQLGNGTSGTFVNAVPAKIAGLTGVSAVAAGDAHSLALKTDGTVWAWGYNGNGQLGDGSTTMRTAPVQVTGLTGVANVSAGISHTLAKKTDGTVWTWGYNYYGQLGVGTSGAGANSTPVQVAGLTGVTAAVAGGNHALAVTGDGTVWGWGKNDFGQLGDGSISQRTAPVPASATGASAVTAAGNYSLALKADGTVLAWGENKNCITGSDSCGGPNAPGPFATITMPEVKYAAHGTISGLKIKAATPAAWGAISWNGVTPAGTAIKFRTRGANSEGELGSAAWSDYYLTSGSRITGQSLWLEVELTLQTSDAYVTPQLDDFTISYSPQ